MRCIPSAVDVAEGPVATMVVKWCQSKHVRLITKCYPPRTASPPKPNSSELSYLTYYTFTKPSKLKKVGHYLEDRACSGIIKGRTGYVVQVRC